MKFWDTAGQEKFAVVSKNYYRVAHGIILCSSITDRDSFINLKKWFKSIKDSNTNENLRIIIVSTKCDLEEERKVKKEEFQQLADEIKAQFFETSAKENFGIEKAFDTITNEVIEAIYPSGKSKEANVQNGRDRGTSFALDKSPNSKPSGGCCKS